MVIRYEGPVGGPGMRARCSIPTSALAGMKLDKSVALITDGRFSGGASRSASIGHVRQRGRAVGGNIALIEEGDVIDIDIPGGRISACAWTTIRWRAATRHGRLPAPKGTTGWLARYASWCRAQTRGAVMQK